MPSSVSSVIRRSARSEWLPIRWPAPPCGAPARGRRSPTGPAGRTSPARRPRPARRAIALGVSGRQGWSGARCRSSARPSRATPWSSPWRRSRGRRACGRARARARHASSWAGRIATAGAMPVGHRARRPAARAPSGASPSWDDDQHRAARRRRARRPAPGRGRACAGSRGEHERRQLRAGQLERAVAELRRLQRLGREPGRLLERQRAHLGGGPRRSRAPSSASTGRSPSQRGERRRRRSSGSSAAARMPSAPSAAAPSPVARRRARRAATSVAANVIVEGPCSSPPGCRARCRRPGQRAVGAVRDADQRSAGPSPTVAARRPSRTSSALSPDWLTATSSVPDPSDVQPEVQELGGVHHRRADALRRRAG